MKELILKRKDESSESGFSYKAYLLDDDGLVIDTCDYDEGWCQELEHARQQLDINKPPHVTGDRLGGMTTDDLSEALNGWLPDLNAIPAFFGIRKKNK